MKSVSQEEIIIVTLKHAKTFKITSSLCVITHFYLGQRFSRRLEAIVMCHYFKQCNIIVQTRSQQFCFVEYYGNGKSGKILLTAAYKIKPF